MRKLFLPLLLACTACTSGAGTSATPATAVAPAAKAAPAAPEQGGTLAQIRALIGNAACSDSAQCRTLPVGARACGGPEGYLAWSTAQTAEPVLSALGQRYKAEREAHNKASGMLSDCRFIADPGAACKAGSCKLAPLGPEAR